MKNHSKLSKNIQFVISIFVIFTVFPNTTIAQQTVEDLIARADHVDNEINILTHEKEAISLKFKGISDFSIKARFILRRFKELNKEIVSNNHTLRIYRETGMDNHPIYKEAEKEVKLQVYERDGLLGDEGVLSPQGVQCKMFYILQNEYNRTANDYLELKTKYDKIAKELGELNVEKGNLEMKIKSMGDDKNTESDLTGCWKLKFGNHISEIYVYKNELGKFVGELAVNNLKDYVDGQVMFVVSRINNNVFSGKEYIWEEKPNGTLGKKGIHATITLNTDNNYLTWTSDQTVTMSRCK